MKKQNMITMLILVGIITLIVIFILATGRTSLAPKPNQNPNGGGTQQESEKDDYDVDHNTESTEEVGTTETTESTENSEETNEPDSSAPSVNVTASMDTALFIGDSRTVGIQAYTKDLTSTADFFAAVSTTITGVVNYNDKIDVEGVGNVTISELLSQKKYDKVYIMLGINEASDYPFNIARNTQKLIDIIQEKQPGCVIFIVANLYVSEEYQSSRPAFSTANMQEINSAQGALANNQNVFYLDPNFMFADANGNLSSEYSGDGCHLRAQPCKTLVNWLIEQTKSLLGL